MSVCKCLRKHLADEGVGTERYDESGMSVSTACAPACDSSLRFYTTDWKPLADSQFISLPVMSDFLSTPDSTTIYDFDEAAVLLICC